MKTIVLDGDKIVSLSTFYDETQRKLCPGFEGYGRNLDAFNDILRGGFGMYEYGEPFRLIWNDAAKSRDALGYDETLRYLGDRLQRVHPSNVDSVKERIRPAKLHQGHTLFDDIIDIIKSHTHIEFTLNW
jgi:RNAse (barnase) inhibitor barstar